MAIEENNSIWIVEYRAATDKPYCWRVYIICESERAAKMAMDRWEKQPRKWFTRRGCQYNIAKQAFFNGSSTRVTWRLRESLLITEAGEREHLAKYEPHKVGAA